MRRRLRTLSVIVVVLASVAACSQSTVDGAPTASAVGSGTTSTPRGSGTTFDPCTDISDAEVTSYGLDPSTREVSAVQDAGLGKGCGWKNKDVLLDFLVTDQTVDGLAARRAFINTKKISVYGRDSVQFQVEATRSCNVGITSQSTAVIVSLTVAFSSIGTVNPCATALGIANKLAPTLPK